MVRMYESRLPQVFAQNVFLVTTLKDILAQNGIDGIIGASDLKLCGGIVKKSHIEKKKTWKLSKFINNVLQTNEQFMNDSTNWFAKEGTYASKFDLCKKEMQHIVPQLSTSHLLNGDSGGLSSSSDDESDDDEDDDDQDDHDHDQDDHDKDEQEEDEDKEEEDEDKEEEEESEEEEYEDKSESEDDEEESEDEENDE